MTTVQEDVSEQRQNIWIRGLIMLCFMIAFGIAQAVLNAAALLQFLWVLISGEPNPFLVRFGKSLGNWLAQVASFQTFASDDKPFPWRDWPAAGPNP